MASLQHAGKETTPPQAQSLGLAVEVAHNLLAREGTVVLASPTEERPAYSSKFKLMIQCIAGVRLASARDCRVSERLLQQGGNCLARVLRRSSPLISSLTARLKKQSSYV